MNTAADVLKESEQKAAVLKRWLTGPDAQAALKILREEFSERTSFVPGDPHATHFKEGERHVILFLEDMRESNYE